MPKKKNRQNRRPAGVQPPPHLNNGPPLPPNPGLGVTFPPPASELPTAPKPEFIWKVHSYTNDYIRFADTKAGAVIAWCAGLIGVLFAAKAHHNFTKTALTFKGAEIGPTALGIGSLVAFLFLAGGVVAAFVCIKPRLWSKEDSKAHEPGFIYWGSIRSHDTSATFSAVLNQQDSDALVGHCAEHVFVLAGITQRKYWWVDRGIWLGLLGSIFASLVALFAQ